MLMIKACSSCIHNDVCSLKAIYNEATDKIKLVKIGEGKILSAYNNIDITIACSHRKEESYGIR